jgi:hypothetical protein
MRTVRTVSKIFGFALVFARLGDEKITTSSKEIILMLRHFLLQVKAAGGMID